MKNGKPYIMAVLCVSALAAGGCGKPKAQEPANAFPFPLGAAVSNEDLNSQNPQHGLLRYFDIYVAGNEMKVENIQPREGVFRFEKGDALAAYAHEHHKKLRGHTLVWHSQIPAWFFQAQGTGEPASKEELYARMERHIKETVSHYKGRIDSWDVVNEVVGDDGGPRDSPFYRIAGSYDYVLRAFQWAHEADPEAKLFMNDYNVEAPGKKQNAFYELAVWLKEQGAPIDGVGLQSHISIYWPQASDFRRTIDRFAALGLKVQITELDMSIFRYEDTAKTKTADQVEECLRTQAVKYGELFTVFEEAAAAGKLDMVLVWGLSDGASWLNGFPVPGRTDYPLLFDRDYQPKSAFRSLTDKR